MMKMFQLFIPSERTRALVACAILSSILVAMVLVACGVKAGERRPARPTPVEQFHRTPVAALEQTRVDIVKTDTGCRAQPADLKFTKNQRVNLAIQIPAEIAEGQTRSLILRGEKVQATYSIPGLQITGAAGAFFNTDKVDLTIESGSRPAFQFTVANAGQFDILCDGAKIGTLTVTE